MSFLQNLQDYQPTKAALGWAAGGAAVLTMVVGFTLGGWVTGGTADRMAQEARTGGQTELAAAVCAANFRTVPTAQATHAELAALTTTRQRTFVQEQPWAEVPGMGSPNRAVADACARIIADMDPDELGAPAAI